MVTLGITQSYQAVDIFHPVNIQTGSYLYCLETHIRSTYPLEGAEGCRSTNDLKNFIIGQKMCGQCSGKYTLWHQGCMDITRQLPISQWFSGKLSACANSGYVLHWYCYTSWECTQPLVQYRCTPVNPLGPIAPKGAWLTLYCFVASHFAMPFPQELAILLAVC